MSKTTILFQGDSITDCGRVSGVNSEMGVGYAAMVKARVMCDRPETEWNFINRGISGNRIVDLYARWKSDCLNLAPDVLSILIGVNDTWHEFGSNNGVEVPRYERFYRELMEWTRSALPEIRIVLMEPFLLPHNADIAKMVADVDARRDVVKRVAHDFGATFVPLQDIFNAASERAPMPYWSGDGVHPSQAGHQLIADAWLNYAAIA